MVENHLFQIAIADDSVLKQEPLNSVINLLDYYAFPIGPLPLGLGSVDFKWVSKTTLIPGGVALIQAGNNLPDQQLFDLLSKAQAKMALGIMLIARHGQEMLDVPTVCEHILTESQTLVNQGPVMRLETAAPQEFDAWWGCTRPAASGIYILSVGMSILGDLWWDVVSGVVNHGGTHTGQVFARHFNRAGGVLPLGNYVAGYGAKFNDDNDVKGSVTYVSAMEDAIRKGCNTFYFDFLWAGNFDFNYWKQMRWAILAAYRLNLLTVFPGGNISQAAMAPTWLESLHLRVAGTKNDGTFWSGESYPGDVSAPAFNDDGAFGGTSVAGPWVAILASFIQQITAPARRWYITKLASHGWGRSNHQWNASDGWGLINVSETVKEALREREPADTWLNVTLLADPVYNASTNEVKINVRITYADGKPVSYGLVGGGIAWDTNPCPQGPHGVDIRELDSNGGAELVLGPRSGVSYQTPYGFCIVAGKENTVSKKFTRFVNPLGTVTQCSAGLLVTAASKVMPDVL